MYKLNLKIFASLSIFLFFSCEKEIVKFVDKPIYINNTDTIVSLPDTIIYPLDTVFIPVVDTLFLYDTLPSVSVSLLSCDTIIYVAKYSWVSTEENGVDVEFPKLNIFVTEDILKLQFIFDDKNSLYIFQNLDRYWWYEWHVEYHVVNGIYQPFKIVTDSTEILSFENTIDEYAIRFKIVSDNREFIVVKKGDWIFTLKKPENLLK